MKRLLTIAAALLVAAGAQAQQVRGGMSDAKAPKTEKAGKATKTEKAAKRSKKSDEPIPVVAAQPASQTASTTAAQASAKKAKNPNRWQPGATECSGCCGECECRLEVPNGSYINLSANNMSAKIAGTLNAHSNRGGALEIGKTFFFNAKKPLVLPGLGEIRWGLDASFVDMQFNEFDILNDDGSKRNGYYGHIGMQAGPSITVTPLKDLHFRLYGHYAPSFAVFTLGDNIDYGGMFGYAGYITGGLHASWRFITLGAEVRATTATMSKVSEENFGTDYEIPENVEDFDPGTVEWKLRDMTKVKTKFPGVRLTLGFRF